MPSRELTNGLPAEIVMQTSYEQGGQNYNHVFEEKGRVVYMNHSYYIRYEEKNDEGTVPVTIKINPAGTVDLIRRGNHTTRLTFDNDKITQTKYQTPAGIMPLKVETENVKISYYDRPFAGRVAVDYGLYVGEQTLGTYQMRLRFTT